MLSPKPAWLEPLFPWPQRQITANGRRTAYIDRRQPCRPARTAALRQLLYRDLITPWTRPVPNEEPAMPYARESAAEVLSGIACLGPSALW